MNVRKISFVLPMYNEKEGIKQTIDQMILYAQALAKEYEIIFSESIVNSRHMIFKISLFTIVE